MNRVDFPSLPILIVDDEEQALESFEIALRTGGINNIITCQDSRKVIEMISSQEVELLLLDLWMPYVSGEEILLWTTQNLPDIPVIIITGVNEVDMAVKCMKIGAFDYMVKPVERSHLLAAVSRVIELRGLQRENRMLKQRVLSKKIENPQIFSQIITKSEKMISVFQYVEAIASSSQHVMITGETGVGKELIAKAIHTLSKGKGPFISVNVAGLEDGVFSDTLFGHRKGAFTGADSARAGIIEQAKDGTLFLDEIGDLSISSQVKLLRLLQEREYFPVGSDMPKRTNARIIVATNQDINLLQETGKFRKDLYYRLHTHHVHIPPLRERLEDLPLLIEYFIKEASNSFGKRIPTYPKELPILLSTYSFPGNVRELRAIIYDAISKHKSGILSMDTFKEAIGQRETGKIEKYADHSIKEEESSVLFSERLPTLEEINKLLIKEALKRSSGNQTIAARILGISRQALNRRLKGLEK